MSSIQPQVEISLGAAVAKVAEQRELQVERFRIEGWLAESRHAWPGAETAQWATWAVECVRSLGLRARVAALSLREALDLVEDGAMLLCRPSAAATTVAILSFDGRTVELFEPATGEVRSITPSGLEAMWTPSDGESPAPKTVRWVVVEDYEVSHDLSHRFEGRPIARLVALLKPERSDIWVVAVFAFFAGVLSLATPIAVESLVNIVAFGRLLQPLLILSLMLFGFLAFASLMRALQTFAVEIIQRRLFARVAADLAYRFPRVTQQSLDGHFGPELANRFFDVVTLQKVVAQLLLDGVALILATAVGMAVLAFYHPWLLGFDILLLTLIVGGIYILGRGAIASGIDESKQKYRLAAWLEDLIRCPTAFKAGGASEFALDRANRITGDYLNARREHFRVLFRQLLFILGLQALAGTVLLGFGGWLVIRGQLTLGQLVAAELIVATILAAMAKLGKHIEAFYDVVAAVDKLGHLFDLEIEPQDGLMAFRPIGGAEVQITDVRHRLGGPWPVGGLTASIERGERVALLGHGAGTASTLFDMLYGLRTPTQGHLQVDRADPRDLRPDLLRSSVALVRGVEIFSGSVAENVQLARPHVSMTDVRTALESVGLLDGVLRLSDGLDTPLTPSGSPLHPVQVRQLVIARALAAKSQLILIDDLLDGLGDQQLPLAVQALCDPAEAWTVIVATKREDVARRFERTIDLRL